MEQNEIRQEPLYLKISNDWFSKAKGIKKAIFYKFFCLWSSFNALYNLVGNYDTKDNVRIHKLIEELSENDAGSIIRDTKKNCDFFMLQRGPIQDMQKRLFGLDQPDDVKNFNRIKAKYSNPDVSNKKKLKYLVDVLYRVRNNLTHGSKEVSGMDKEVILNAVPILEKLIRVISSRVFEQELK